MDDNAPIVIIAGPTASGKSALAVRLAERFGGEVVNGDSMQVYRDLHILTARPDADELARVPHHLFGFVAPSERFSAGQWLAAARPVLADIQARGRLAVVAGGTGLYLRALTQGLAPVPEIPAAVVDRLSAHFDAIGGAAFRTELASVDPDGAARLPASDRQRLIRAAAVFAETGRPLSAWQAQQPAAPGYPARFCTVLLLPPRAELYADIDARFGRMLDAGALDEARAFAQLGVADDLPAARAVGVAELLRVVRGEWDLALATEKAKTASRNLAKRQITWFKRQINADLVISEKYSESEDEKIFSFIRQFVLTSHN